MKRLFAGKDTIARLLSGLFLIGISVACAIALGFLFGIIYCAFDGFSFENFWKVIKICYIWFCAGFSVAGVLLWITSLDADKCITLGAVSYYGTIFLGGFFKIFFIRESDAYFAAIIIFLVIIFSTNTKNKRERENDD